MSGITYTIRKKNKFTIIPNAIFTKNLSAKAIGFYAVLSSKPDGWQFHRKEILKSVSDKDDSYYSAMKELQEKGAIKVELIRDLKGRFVGNDIIFLDLEENEEKSIEKSAFYPHRDFPDMVNPEKEKPEHNNTYNNKNIYIKNSSNFSELNFDNFKEEMVEPLKRWCEYKEIGKGQPLNQFSLNEAYEFLLTISSGSKEYAERIVSHCILKNWTQLFSIRGENKKPKLKETIYKDKQNYKEIDKASKTESIPIETEIPPKISTEYDKIKDEASEEFLEEVSRCFEINNYKAWLEDIKYTFSGNVINLYFRNSFIRDFVARDYLQGVCKGDKIIRRGLKDLIKEFYPNIEEIKLI